MPNLLRRELPMDGPPGGAARVSDDINREARSAADAAAAIEYADGIIDDENAGENKFQKAISAWRSEHREHGPAVPYHTDKACT